MVGDAAEAPPLGERLRAVRKDAAARRIVHRWRELTDSAPTLVACSGGADSTALLLALVSAKATVIVGHVVHDMRSREDALADRDRACELAKALGVEFVEAEAPRGEGNVEAALRRARYDALAAMARARGMGFVATGHTADDQLESVVMALLRGSGPRGLGGAAAGRPIGEGVALVRPMLGAERADAERLCRLARIEWSEDATNRDRQRARAALRHGPLAELKGMRPGAARRASAAAGLLRDAAGLVADRAREVFDESDVWERESLRRERAIVVGEGLRRAIVRRTGGAGADRLSRRRLAPIVKAIRDDRGDWRRFHVVGGFVVLVGKNEVQLIREGDAPS